MIYIEIPEGMVYEPYSLKNAADKIVGIEDRFVSISGKKEYISIQNAVHDFYHKCHSSMINSGIVHGLTFHKKKPTAYDSPLLEYRAINTGRSPTDHAKAINLRSVNPRAIASSSLVGRWINHTLLSPKRHEEAKQKEEEQKYNRRKWGDSPNAN